MMVFTLFAAMPLTASAADYAVVWTKQPTTQYVTEGQTVTFECAGVVSWIQPNSNVTNNLQNMDVGHHRWLRLVSGGWRSLSHPDYPFLDWWTNYSDESATLSFKALPEHNGMRIKYQVGRQSGLLGMGVTDYETNGFAAVMVKSAAPVISNISQSQTVGVGETASFTVNATGTGTLAYQWFDNEGNFLTDGVKDYGTVSGATTKTLTITDTKQGYGSTGQSTYRNFRCRVINTNGAASPSDKYYADASLHIYTTLVIPAYIITHPVNRTVGVGDTATFSIEASGAETYQWETFTGSAWSNVTNNATYSGATTGTLEVRNATLAMSGTQYRCTVTNNNSTVNSHAAVLSVYQALDGSNPILPSTARIDTQPSGRSIATGQSTTFHVEASGMGLNYQWQYMPPFSSIGAPWTDISDGGIYSGATTDTLRLTDVPASYANHDYRCVVKYIGIGMTTRTIESDSAKLTITDAGSGLIANKIIFSGMTGMTLFEGYGATSTDAYSILRMSFSSALQPTFTVTQDATHGGKITWNNTTKKLDIAAGLAKGTYPVVMTATDGGSDNVTLTFTLTVTDETIPPGINGAAEMTLVAGYAATSTEAYTITGSPAPTVTKTSGNAAITWDNAGKRFNIAAGLALGTYDVALLAVNSVGESELAFTLTVAAELEVVVVEGDDDDDELPPPEIPFPFTDVLPSHWFYNDVKTAWEQGLVNGTTATTYSPDNNLTYAEAIKLAACMHQLYTTGTVTLTNGSPNWYDSYVTYAKNNGIINKDYTWGAQATRAGYMEIFANALPASALAAINTVPDNSIPDVPMTHPQAVAIYKLYRAGILQGVDAAHNCNPGSNIKRSEVAAILTRMMNDTKRVSFSM